MSFDKIYQGKNVPSCILQIDQEKVFDKIDREFFYKTIETMAFSSIFISFRKILF